MLNFLVKELWSSANCFCPMGEGTYDTVLGNQIMITIPLYILGSMGGFSLPRN